MMSRFFITAIFFAVLTTAVMCDSDVNDASTTESVTEETVTEAPNDPGDGMLSPDEQELFLVETTSPDNNITRQCGRSKSESLTCPDKDIIFYLYSGPNAERETIDVMNPDWLTNSKFDSTKPSVLLIHGYRGGDSLMPLVILKDAYIKLNTHNVIMTDWGILAKGSCYTQAVGSLKAVAKCTGFMLNYFETSGIKFKDITCVGHSLGAHICGLVANYVPEKMEYIVGLDPARPLLSRRRAANRLDESDAKLVQVIHTNAGFYGEGSRMGTVDFCVNNGRIQPFCEKAKNEQLCSHIEAVCFFAESLFKEKSQQGLPCSRCPVRNFDRNPQPGKGIPVTMGVHLEPTAANGMYCVRALEPPYCLNPESADPEYGDKRCCLKSS